MAHICMKMETLSTWWQKCLSTCFPISHCMGFGTNVPQPCLASVKNREKSGQFSASNKSEERSMGWYQIRVLFSSPIFSSSFLSSAPLQRYSTSFFLRERKPTRRKLHFCLCPENCTSSCQALRIINVRQVL